MKDFMTFNQLKARIDEIVEAGFGEREIMAYSDGLSLNLCGYPLPGLSTFLVLEGVFDDKHIDDYSPVTGDEWDNTTPDERLKSWNEG